MALSYEAGHRTAIELLRDWSLEDLRIVVPSHRGDLVRAVETLSRATPEQTGWVPQPTPLDAELIEASRRDLLLAQVLAADGRLFKEPFVLRTDSPVAVRSSDHVNPRGTKFDNTRHPAFVAACELLFNHEVRALDLGCAGGGLVLDFLLRGHRAIGLDGSDYSLRRQRAEWRVIPRHLITCDITRPFQVLDDELPAVFDVITAWEVLEHIREDEVPALLHNIRRHLAQDGLFVASVAQVPDTDLVTGTVYHHTIRPAEWWQEVFRANGFHVREGLFEVDQYARGSGNGPLDWDVRARPDIGFHLVASLPSASPRSQVPSGRFDFFRLCDGRPSFKPDAGPSQSPPIVVISMPKAGTYLFSKMLSVLGFVDTEIHAGQNGFDDYRGRSLDESRCNYLEYGVSSPFTETARLITAGQFMVGHIPRTDIIETALQSFRRFLLVRNLRDAIVSHMRFIASTGRGGWSAKAWRAMPDGPDKLLAYLETHGAAYLGMCEDVSLWLTDTGCFQIRFEILMGDKGTTEADSLVRGVQEVLNRASVRSWSSLAPSFIGVPTLTYSGERTQRLHYWDERVARRFEELGGDALNARFGYYAEDYRRSDPFIDHTLFLCTAMRLAPFCN